MFVLGKLTVYFEYFLLQFWGTALMLANTHPFNVEEVLNKDPLVIKLQDNVSSTKAV